MADRGRMTENGDGTVKWHPAIDRILECVNEKKTCFYCNKNTNTSIDVVPVCDTCSIMALQADDGDNERAGLKYWKAFDHGIEVAKNQLQQVWFGEEHLKENPHVREMTWQQTLEAIRKT